MKRKAIQKERGVELCGEGHRRFDLVRWGIWYETAKAAMVDEAPARANLQTVLSIYANSCKSDVA